MVAAKKKDAKECAWRGCTARPTRVLSWGDGVQQEFCEFHAEAALTWARVREQDWSQKKGEDNAEANE